MPFDHHTSKRFEEDAKWAKWFHVFLLRVYRGDRICWNDMGWCSCRSIPGWLKDFEKARLM